MNAFHVLCNGATGKAITDAAVEKVILETEGADPTVHLGGDAFRNKLDPLSKRQADLLHVAAFVYAADTRCRRGKPTDVFGLDWVRDFRFVMPVWDPAFWSKTEVCGGLVDTLSYLTGDRYSFEFVQKKTRSPSQALFSFNFKDLVTPLPAVDQVIMFSGGADSLAAVIESVKSGHHPHLVSHRAAPIISARQEKLVNLLRARFSPWQFPHLSLWVNRQGTRSTEFSQRSRSFLFSALGAITANLLSVDDILLSDNGVVSINLPRSGQNIGTGLSRSTHPKYIRLAENLFRQTLNQPKLTITNSLLNKTKKEVVELIAGSGHPDLLQETVSCAHVEGKTTHQPHCGVCTQCIDRRFATSAARLEKHDLVGGYEVDIFSAAIAPGEDRTHVENFLRQAKKLEEVRDPEAFFSAYPELIDSLVPGEDADAKGKLLFDLFQRHQVAVNAVIDRQLQDKAHLIRRGELPKDTLLSLLASGRVTEDPKARYVDRLRELLQKSLPAAFQSRAASDERNVQDVGESCFIAAQTALAREAPQLPFATVSTKPDFSQLPADSSCPALFVEFKFIKTRARKNAVVTEMTSRVTIYRDQGAWVLFIVYDPKRHIADDDAFVYDFEKHEGIFIGIAR